MVKKIVQKRAKTCNTKYGDPSSHSQQLRHRNDYKRNPETCAENPGLIGKFFSYLSFCSRNIPSSSLQFNANRKQCKKNEESDHEVELNDICYSECTENEVDDIKAKWLMLEEQKKRRKTKKYKIRNRKQTYHRYKKQAREVEKKVKMMEKEKIRQEEEALRKAHEIQTSKLLKAQKLLKEKKKKELEKLKNREKMIDYRMRSLRKQLKVKCDAICYEIEDTGNEQSESYTEDRNHRNSSHSSESSQHGYNKEIVPSKSDEDVCRVLNVLLDTDICFDHQIILKIKKLLKTDSKMREFFDGYGRSSNNLENQLRFQLCNRIGPHSKLKLFLTSKNKKMNREHRDLLRSILDQVIREEDKKSDQGESTLEKIYRYIWRKGHEDKAEDMQRLNKDESRKSATQRYIPYSMKRQEIVARTRITRGVNTLNKRQKSKAQQTDSKIETTVKNKREIKVSPRSNISFELRESRLNHQKQIPRNHNRKEKRNRSVLSQSPECYSLHQSKSFQMDKSRQGQKLRIHDSDNQVEPIATKEVTKLPVSPITKLNLWRYFTITSRRTNRIDQKQVQRKNQSRHRRSGEISKTLESNCDGRSKNRQEINEKVDRNFFLKRNEVRRHKSRLDSSRQENEGNERKYEIHNDKQDTVQSKCVRCAKAWKTDTKSDNTSESSDGSYYETGTEPRYQTDISSSEDKAEEQNYTRENPPRVGGILWNLFSKRDRDTRTGGQCTRERHQRTSRPEVYKTDRKRKTGLDG